MNRVVRRWMIPALVGVAMVPSGFAVAQAVGTDDPQRATSSSVSTVHEAAPEGLRPATPEEMARALAPSGTPLSDCPEALRFFQEPEVQRFYEERFGHAPTAADTFAGGCPDADRLRADYEAMTGENP
jgi:hypothetical protein